MSKQKGKKKFVNWLVGMSLIVAPKSKEKNRMKNWIINTGLIIFLLVGIILIFNNQIKYFIIEHNSEKYAVTNQTVESIAKNQNMEATYDFDSVTPINSTDVIKAEFSDKRLPTIGGVAVPNVSINLPIFKGVTNDGLKWGAVTLSADQVMGQRNYALASHRSRDLDLLFTPLERVEMGDLIYLTDLTNIYTYQTVSKERVLPTRVDVLDEVEGENIVTLITCGEIGGKTRIIVQGELIGTTPVEEATPEMLDAFQIEQKTH